MSIGLIGTICGLVIVFLFLFVFNNVAYAQSTIIQNVSSSNSTLSVIGNAEAMVKPDKVTLTLSVETTNKTANAALIANSETMNNVLDALKSSGVKENETSTSFFNISPNYNITQEEDFRPIQSRDIIGYTVTNSITVDSPNLLNVSQWIDTAVQAGANDVSSISFILSDKKSELIKNDLLRQAIMDAKNNADISASALGLKVVGVRSIIIERVDGIPVSSQQSFFASQAVDSAAPRASPPPIIVGEQKVTSSVNITFLIN
ncbi:MAG: SIMPL domain-containing protein [Nitrososphaeraceae archaeon]